MEVRHSKTPIYYKSKTPDIQYPIMHSDDIEQYDTIFAQSFLENILDTILDVVFVVNTQGIVLLVNKRVITLLQVDAKNILYKSINHILSPSDTIAADADLWYTRCDVPLNAHFFSQNNDSIPLEIHIRKIELHGNDMYLITGSDVRLQHQLISQVGERESMLRCLAVSEQKFQNMFIHSSSGIVIIDLQSETITEVNPAAEKIFGVSAKVLYGKKLQDVGMQISEEEWIGYLEHILADEHIENVRMTFQLSKKSALICKAALSPIEINQRRCLMLDIADITVQEKMFSTVVHKKKLETVGILAGGIAHDFNNILAVILGQIGIAKIKNKQPDLTKPLHESEKACMRAREMTQALLTFSRGGQPVLSWFDPESVIAEAIEFTLKNYPHASCSYASSKSPCVIHADRIQFSQIVSNLLYNALHAMYDHGIVFVQTSLLDLTHTNLEKPVSLIGGTSLSNQMYMCMTIRDTGCGIDKKLHEKIFEPFFTLRKSGNGMGLAIVLSIVNQHGGAISLKSRVGKGTELSVFIPAKKAECEPHPKNYTDTEASLSNTNSQKKRILVMDDDADVRNMVYEILCALNYDVVLVNSGEQAISCYVQSFDENPYAAIILDLIVPNGMGGVETAQELRLLNSSVILLVSSGYSDDPVLSDFRSYNFDGVIRKPYLIDEIRCTLETVLG